MRVDRGKSSRTPYGRWARSFGCGEAGKRHDQGGGTGPKLENGGQFDDNDQPQRQKLKASCEKPESRDAA
ncbi:hypothetical protein RLO149_c034910 [Roseobacter litoralis Och 149]|uniref:Uncharacterized protein n=1 Tax=Roseobacter litoralis (strain ATCC 49566 / DSM 6996 / JCM 21268 / NBRC 15278 / OCh 149) TaxID=391595 RepID=F7ZA85_ROSLO|nr:hypothetical protein RLO149_c034910 [Roseobacter litoralis Och 149]